MVVHEDVMWNFYIGLRKVKNREVRVVDGLNNIISGLTRETKREVWGPLTGGVSV